MSNKRTRASRTPAQPGVWNRGTGRGPKSPIRVRTKRLDQIDGDKIALAYWLLAKKLVADGSGQNVSEEEANRVAKQLDGQGVPAGPESTA